MEGNMCADGAYELLPADGDALVSVLASGSEVEIAQEIRTNLQTANIPTRVVSMPCWELFAALPTEKRASILGKGTLKVGVEAAVRNGWDRWLGETGMFFGMTGFGASGPYKHVYNHFGLTSENITSMICDRLEPSASNRKG